jgi:hypothetical protein
MESSRPFVRSWFLLYYSTNARTVVVSRCWSARAGTTQRERDKNNNARNHGASDGDDDDDDENVAMVRTQRAQSDEEEDYHRNRSFRFFHIG